MINVFLLLGGNLGHREFYMQKAVQLIGEGIATVRRQSALYETQSWGKTDEPDYLNQVIELQTDLPAMEVLQRVLAIEAVLGRERKEKWGARVIDIDILLYDDAIINQTGLIVPHPEMHNRRFTLEPLGELAPDMVHPLLNKSILQLKNELNDSLVVKKL